MKRFLIKVILFCTAFCAVQLILNALFLKGMGIPYAYNKRFYSKYIYYKLNETQYNTVFFGSSRTYREIDPGIIDQQLENFEIKSYNAGSPATFTPESFYLLEMFLKNIPPEAPVRYVFFELSDLSPIKYVNWFSPQSYYYLDSKYMKLVWDIYMENPGMNPLMKAIRLFPYLLGYGLNHIFLLNPLDATPVPIVYLGEAKNGYYPLELDMHQNQSKELVARHQGFIQDTFLVQKRINSQKKISDVRVSQAYVDFLNELIEKAEQRQIKLYFLIPPKLKNYKVLSDVQEKVHDSRVIDMGRYDKYPELYVAKYWFDHGHFNTLGSGVYSEYVATEIRDKLSGAD